MAILKISFVLTIMSCLSVTITEAGRLEENNEGDTLEMTKKKVDDVILLQSSYEDRGYIARRNITIEELLAKDSEIIDNYDSTLKKELECGFVFSALVHVYLTNVNSLEQEKLTFTEEAAYMISYALDHKKSNLLEVMWLVYFYNSQTDELMESFENGRDDVDYKNILLTSKAALEKVLEEFTESYECKVYDRETCEVQEVKYVDKIKEVMEGQSTGVPLTLKSNKERFSVQRNINLSDFICNETSKIGLEQLRFSHLIYVVGDLIKTFFVQVDSGPIVEYFIECYKNTYMTYIAVVPLQEYIDSFITLQYNVIMFLKAMTLRIVAVYLKSMNENLKSITALQKIQALSLDYTEHNQKMITLLTDFASFIGQPDDEYLKEVILIFSSFLIGYKGSFWFDDNIKAVFSLLNHMTSDNKVLSTFSNRLMVNDFSLMIDFNDIFKKYNVAYSKDFNPVTKIIAITEIYITQIKKINEGVDFGVYNSIVSLKESGYYKRLVHLETDGENKKIK